MGSEAFIVLLPNIVMLALTILVIKRIVETFKAKKTKSSVIYFDEQPQKNTNNYYETDYYKETGRRYEDTITDKGRAGEYAAYRAIKDVKGYCRWLFNTYIPDPKGQTKDTEIDVLLIHESGIYVIECKNYSGWIYGDETNEKWCEVFKSRRKFYFFSPILQNYRHIEYLRSKIDSRTELNSIIVFSDSATLKKIVNTNPALKVINTNALRRTLQSLIDNSSTKLQPAQVDEIYYKLKGINLQPTDIQEQQQYSKADETAIP